jgi:hypothetical protein
MWRRRSPRTPIWVWVLALLGLQSIWLWRRRAADPIWQDKRRRFAEKIDEAFSVWNESGDAQADNPGSDQN